MALSAEQWREFREIEEGVQSSEFLRERYGDILSKIRETHRASLQQELDQQTAPRTFGEKFNVFKEEVKAGRDAEMQARIRDLQAEGVAPERMVKVALKRSLTDVVPDIARMFTGGEPVASRHIRGATEGLERGRVFVSDGRAITDEITGKTLPADRFGEAPMPGRYVLSGAGQFIPLDEAKALTAGEGILPSGRTGAGSMTAGVGVPLQLAASLIGGAGMAAASKSPVLANARVIGPTLRVMNAPGVKGGLARTVPVAATAATAKGVGMGARGASAEEAIKEAVQDGALIMLTGGAIELGVGGVAGLSKWVANKKAAGDLGDAVADAFESVGKDLAGGRQAPMEEVMGRFRALDPGLEVPASLGLRGATEAAEPRRFKIRDRRGAGYEAPVGGGRTVPVAEPSRPTVIDRRGASDLSARSDIVGPWEEVLQSGSGDLLPERTFRDITSDRRLGDTPEGRRELADRRLKLLGRLERIEGMPEGAATGQVPAGEEGALADRMLESRLSPQASAQRNAILDEVNRIDEILSSPLGAGGPEVPPTGGIKIRKGVRPSAEEARVEKGFLRIQRAAEKAEAPDVVDRLVTKAPITPTEGQILAPDGRPITSAERKAMFGQDPYSLVEPVGAGSAEPAAAASPEPGKVKVRRPPETGAEKRMSLPETVLDKPDLENALRAGLEDLARQSELTVVRVAPHDATLRESMVDLADDLSRRSADIDDAIISRVGQRKGTFADGGTAMDTADDINLLNLANERVKTLQGAGQTEKAQRVRDAVAELVLEMGKTARTQGQQISLLAALRRQTPEGMERYVMGRLQANLKELLKTPEGKKVLKKEIKAVQRELKQARAAGDKEALPPLEKRLEQLKKRGIGTDTPDLKLPEDVQDQIVTTTYRAIQQDIRDVMEQVSRGETIVKAKTPYGKVVDMIPEEAMLTIERDIAGLMPKGFNEQLSFAIAVHDLALRVPTALRNLSGYGHLLAERYLSLPLASAINPRVSKWMGTPVRVAGRGQGERAMLKTAGQAVRRELRDLKLGITTRGTAGPDGATMKFDVPTGKRYLPLKKGVGTPFERAKAFAASVAEDALKLTLGPADRAALEINRADSLERQLAGYRSWKGPDAVPSDEEMEEIFAEAVLESARVVFQDNSKLAQKMRMFKDVPVAGPILMNYSTTGSNMFLRSSEYFPPTALLHFASAVKSGSSKHASEALARFGVGAAGVGLGIFAAKEGWVERNKNKYGAKSMLLQAMGKPPYTINASLLLRAMPGVGGSRFEEDGDKIITYEWAQPGAMWFNAGVALYEKGMHKPSDAREVADAISVGFYSGLESFVEQPLMQGITDLADTFAYNRDPETGEFDPRSAGKDILSGLPARVIPLGGLMEDFNKAIIDGTAREVKDPAYFREVVNKSIKGMPGLSKTLPEKIDIEGKNIQYNDGVFAEVPALGNLEVFISPFKARQLDLKPALKLLLDIANETGEESHIPRVVDHFQLDGEQFKLTAVERNAMQIGLSNEFFPAMNEVMQNEFFKTWPAEVQLQYLQNLKNQILRSLKTEYLMEKRKNGNP